MITLITGLPGNGKSLFSLWHIKNKADKENRPVFYHGISNLQVPSTIPWTEFKAEEWHDLPEGAIVLIDEAQFIFPRKPNGSQLPAHYEKLAVHRHKGFDIFIITQHPSLIDNFVRKLVGQHYHSVRKFGMERATIYEWSATSAAPENAASQKSAISLAWPFAKEVYTWYKSAEVHTVKKRVPVKIFVVLAFVLAVIIALVMYVKSYGKGENQAASAVPGQPGSSVVVSASPGAAAAGQARFDAVADAREYVAMNTPRVSGLPQTAPKYDELTKPVRVPIPAACIQVGKAEAGKVGCKCYSQQATPIDVEFNMCVEFARNGFFQDFDADRDRQQNKQAQASAGVLSHLPDVPMRIDHSPERVVAFAEVPVQRVTGVANEGSPSERAGRSVVSE